MAFHQYTFISHSGKAKLLVWCISVKVLTYWDLQHRHELQTNGLLVGSHLGRVAKGGQLPPVQVTALSQVTNSSIQYQAVTLNCHSTKSVFVIISVTGCSTYTEIRSTLITVQITPVSVGNVTWSLVFISMKKKFLSTSIINSTVPKLKCTLHYQVNCRMLLMLPYLLPHILLL